MPRKKEPYDENRDYQLIRDVAEDVIKMVDRRGHLGIMLGMVHEMLKAIHRIDKHSMDNIKNE